MSDQKRFLDKDYTRRQFLKLSGKSLVGVAMSSAMLSTLGVTAGALAEDQVRHSPRSSCLQPSWLAWCVHFRANWRLFLRKCGIARRASRRISAATALL